jgi:hypothetical protein
MTPAGFHLIKILAIVPGARPHETQVLSAHILKRYSPVPSEMSRLRDRVEVGAIDLAFRSEVMLDLVPDRFK